MNNGPTFRSLYEAEQRKNAVNGLVALAMWAVVLAAAVAEWGWLRGLAVGAAVYLLMPYDTRH